MASLSEVDSPAEGPLFAAASSSARQIYLLLKCIAFSPRALVQISAEGLRFTVSQTSVMEAHSFLASNLFTSFTYNAPALQQDSLSTLQESDEEPEHGSQVLEINLPAFLETLQVFGATDLSTRFSRQDPYSVLPSGGAFASAVLGMTGFCRISYASPGSPFEIFMEEAGVRTTCELTTYEPSTFVEDIPFTRTDLQLKIIIRAVSLHDAIGELANTQPECVLLTAADNKTFAMSAEGSLGSANVEFSNSGSTKLMETFQLAGRSVKTAYKFSLLNTATRAMAVATKVSMRIDKQGVLSLQFMVEVEGGGVSFVDFRFVPLVTEHGEVEDEDTDSED